MNRYIALVPGAWAEGAYVNDALNAATAKLGPNAPIPTPAKVYMVGPTCTVGSDGQLHWEPLDMTPVLAYAFDPKA